MKIQDIQAQLAAILRGEDVNNKHLPEKKIEAGEKVVGVLTDPIARSLWSLTEQIDAYLEDYMAMHRPSTEQAAAEFVTKMEEHTQLLMGVAAMSSAVGSCFWARVHEQFPETAHMGVDAAVRQDFQIVVWKKADSSRSISSIIVEVVRKAASAKKEGVPA